VIRRGQSAEIRLTPISLSIGPENSGAAMNDSLTYWAPFVNKYASSTRHSGSDQVAFPGDRPTQVADMIALGTVVSVGSCQGPLIPYMGGCIDATEGGPYGVPEPQGNLSLHTQQFARAGMDLQGMIQVTACGHTVGSTHHAGFPDIVGPEAVTPDNLGGGINFDDTFDAFDNHV
jgi:catalase (peroxidase I)